MPELEYEDAREIYRWSWREFLEPQLLELRYEYGIKARSGGFAWSYHADILLAINDILRSRP